MAALPGGAPRTPDIVVGPVDLAARIDEALAVQALAFGLSDDEVEVRRHIVDRHLLQPGACALGALTGYGRLVGFVYGMPNDRTHWWSTVVEPYLRRGRQRRLARRLLRHHRTARPPRFPGPGHRP